MKTEQMIEELHKIANKHKNDVVGVGELNLHAMCIDVAKRLQELLDKKSRISEWIPCNEKLPECESGQETDALMFQMKDTGTIEVGYYGEGGHWRNRYFRHYRNDTDGVDVSDVIAWMPLPEPYNPNTCKSTECPFYCPKQDCVAKEECGGYTEKTLGTEWKRNFMNRFTKSEV